MGPSKIPSFLHTAVSLRKPTSKITATRRLSTAEISLSSEPSISEEVLTIIETVPDIEPPLDFMVPLLSSHIVTAVLEETCSVRSGLRFFNWSATRKQFCSWDSHKLMVSMLRGDPEFESAWESLSELRSSGVSIAPRVFQVLISAYAKLGMTSKAVESFERMEEFSCTPNTFTYNTLLGILMAEGFVELAMSVYNRMVKLGCCPNRSTFNILINGMCKAGKMKDALALFDDMFDRGISPNVMVYTTVFSCLFKDNRVEDAVGRLHSMKQCGLKPDLVAYNTLLDGFCKMGRIDKAFELLHSDEKEFVPLLSTYSSLIDGLFRAGKFEEACRLFRDMLKINVKPDRVLYTIMIRGYIEAGKVKEAFSFLYEMTDRGIVPDTFCYNTLIKGLCDKGHLSRARSFLLHILRKGIFPDSATFTIMIHGLCKRGRVQEAQQIFNEMTEYGCHPNTITCNVLIDGLCKAGQLKKACNVLHSMEMGPKPYLYLKFYQGSSQHFDCSNILSLVEQLCQSGHLVKAYMVLHELGDSGPAPDIVTYNTLINGFCKEGDMNGAYNLLAELQRKGYFPDEVTYGTLVGGFLRDNKIEFAFRIIDGMMKSGCRLTLLLYTTLMTGLCKMGRVSEAVTFWLNHISRIEEGEEIVVAQTHFAQGSVDEAVRSLIEMHLKHGSCSSLLYSIWVHGFRQVGKLDDAFRIFSVLTEYNIDVTPSSCVKLIWSLCRKWKLSSAVNVMLYTIRKSFRLRNHVGKRLLRCLCIHDNEKVALGLAGRMIQAGYNLDVYLPRISKTLAYNHKPDESCIAGGAVNEINNVMTGLCMAGRVSEAVTVWMNHISNRNNLSVQEDEVIMAAWRHIEQDSVEEAVKRLIEMHLKHDSCGSLPYNIWLNGFCQARKLDEAFRIFSVFTESEIEVNPPTCIKLIYSLCHKWRLASAVDVMLYTIRRGFQLEKSIGNRLLSCLCFEDNKKVALGLAGRMSCAGYDLDVYLKKATKVHLYTHEPEDI